MKIITCIKQVPGSAKVDIDPETRVLIRDGLNVKMNPYDLYALEASFCMKERIGDCKVEAVTMGPPSAKQVLEEALYMGADEATLITDRAFAGADVLATAYTLSQLIRHIGDYNIIVCGKQTTDGDTAQVGPEIAEFLGIPHVPYVIEVVEIKQDSLIVKSSYDDHDEISEVKYPCLLTVDKVIQVPRLPSYRRKLVFSNKKIAIVTLKDLSDHNTEHYGLNGSPTQVEEIFPPDKRTDSLIIEGNKIEVATRLFDILKEQKFL